MLFERFFKPKWQNKNPKIRKQALQAMDASDSEVQEIYREVAMGDADPIVRQYVVRYLDDPRVLQRITQKDVDATVRECASQRLSRLLAGMDATKVSYEERLTHLRDLDDPRMLEFVARNGAETALRLESMERLGKESLFGDVAIKDPDADLRAKAADLITQKSTLERVLKSTRNTDKRVRHMVRARLNELRDVEQRPERLRQTAKNICVQMEALVKSLRHKQDWRHVESGVARLKTDWLTVAGEWQGERSDASDEPLFERFQRADRALSVLLAEAKDAEHRATALESKFEPIRNEKQRVCDGLRAALSEVQRQHQPRADEEERIEQLLVLSQEDFVAAGELPADEEDAIRKTFDGIQNALNDYKADAGRYRLSLASLHDILSEVNELRSSSKAISERSIKGAERRFKALENPRYFSIPETMTSQYHEAIDVLRERHRQGVEKRRAAVVEFRQHVGELEAAVEGGHVQQAGELVRRLQSILKSIAPSDVRALRQQSDYQRYQRATVRIKELQDWQGWAASPKRDQLCEEMDALADEIESHREDPDYDFEAAAKSIQDARQRWKKLGPPSREGAHVAWERFNIACNRAYEPCQRYFDQQAEQRNDNLAKKEELCTRLEKYIEEQVQGADTDWKIADKTVRAAQKEWNDIGAVSHKDHAAIRDRFHKAMMTLREALHEQRERNRVKKEAVVKGVRGVIDELANTSKTRSDVDDAVARVKELQSKWKSIGNATSEKRLWQQFREICDQVFAERQAQTDIQLKERQAHLNHKVTLCTLVENLAQLEGDELKQAQSRVEKIKEEWRQIGGSPREESKHIEKRFAEACRAFERQNALRRLSDKQAEQTLMAEKGVLCTQMESLVDGLMTKRIALHDAEQQQKRLQHQWQSLPSLSARLETAFEDRLDQANGRLTLLMSERPESGEVVTQVKEDMQSNLKVMEELCMRMEILAGIDSPPEAKQARLAFQIANLEDKMKGNTRGYGTGYDASDREEATQIQYNWFSTGPVPAERREVLEHRFSRATRAFLQANEAKSVGERRA